MGKDSMMSLGGGIMHRAEKEGEGVVWLLMKKKCSEELKWHAVHY